MCSTPEIVTSTPAPIRAMMDGSTWMAELATNAAKTKTSTTPDLANNRMSRMASRSFSDITSATRSACTPNVPRNNSGSTTTNAINAMIAIGARCTRKSLNDRFARLPIMMFGGSPISVDTPPMLDASTSAIMKGTGLMSRRSHTSSVTGAISSTMVTFGSSADAAAVIRTRRTITRNGDPPARLAAQIAAYSKAPVWRITPTMIIVPSSRKMTSQSIPVSRE